MPHNSSNAHKRKSIRLKFYDYASIGYYFVTVCCFERRSLFGKVENGKMYLNQYGEIARNEWLATFEKRKNIEIDAFVIMPNHVHFIVHIKEKLIEAENVKRQFNNTSHDLGSIIRGYKSAVTSKLKASFSHPIWQRNYHEHIIRNEKSYTMIYEYINNNPLLWEQDCFYQP